MMSQVTTVNDATTGTFSQELLSLNALLLRLNHLFIHIN